MWVRTYDMVLRAPEGVAGAGGAGDSGAGGAGANQPASWVPTTLDPETIGYIQNRGWATKPVADVALEAIKAHREAERFIGVPPARLVKLPVDATDVNGWNEVYQRLGAPKEAKAYTEMLATVKYPDGAPLEQPLVDRLTKMASTNHLSIDATKALATELVAFGKDVEAADTVTQQQEFALQDQKLRQSWGSNWEVNNVIAQRAAERLGPQFLGAAKALEGKVGYADVMQLFLTLGTRMGEDSFVRNAGGAAANGGVFTKEQAIARKSELMADADWQKRYTAGGVNSPEYKEFQSLIAISLG